MLHLVAKEYNKTQLNVYGFTDSTGAASYKQRLSQVRAAEVGNYLIRQGVCSKPCGFSRYGRSKPYRNKQHRCWSCGKPSSTDRNESSWLIDEFIVRKTAVVKTAVFFCHKHDLYSQLLALISCSLLWGVASNLVLH